MVAEENSFVFLDLKGKRWRRCRLALFCGSLILFLALVLFIRSLLVFPRLHEPKELQDLSNELKALINHKEGLPVSQLPPSWAKVPGPRKAHKNAALQSKDFDRPVSVGFYVKWDPNSFISLRRYGEKLTHVVPEWFSVSGSPAKLSAERDLKVWRYAQRHGLAFMPMLNNLNGDSWEAEAVESLSRAPEEEQQQFFSSVIMKLKELGAPGIVVDWEQIDPSYRDSITALISRFQAALVAENMQLWLCIPVGNDVKVFDLDALADVVDRFVALLYDENGESDDPGPIASHQWFSEWLRVLLEHGSTKQWIIGLGAYGYDWPEGGEAHTVSFADAMARANHSGEGAIDNMPPYYGPHFAYMEKNTPHDVWFLDAVTFRNQKRLAEAQGIGGIAVSRLGSEDEQIWDTFTCSNSCKAAAFETMKGRQSISHIGEGDFITTSDEQKDGRRSIIEDESGVWGTKYYEYPKSLLLYHRGESIPASVALTFDDGPDPEWTPKILDVLKEKSVSATFFVVGNNAASNPALMRRIVKEGHVIGNHTYTHPNLAKISAGRTKLELNATQRVIESITGYSTVLFRPPYNADRKPHTVREFRALKTADELGYITVSESIDLEDWQQPSVEKLLTRLRERRSEGNVILLHDAGGDRSKTVEALPQIIDYLRKRGDSIVPLNDLIGVNREAIMPPIPGEDPADTRLVAKAGFSIIHTFEEITWAFMIVSTALVLLRTCIIIILALINKRREDKEPEKEADTEHPPVSIIMAAHNEAKVIYSTLNSVLSSSYAGRLEVIVVNDGSTDETAALVKAVALCDKRVRLVNQTKNGKAAALNAALRISQHDLIVMLDADTQFEPETIAHLVAPFKNPVVGAVSGHAKVGNQQKLLAKFQDLEYTCGFNLDRRAYDTWNCITVVPGAISAFRRQAINDAGGLPSDTLAEDTDLTLVLHREGYEVRYAPKAIAWTEAPETIRGLVRQRTRWAFGTLQCLWKHRDLVFNPDHKALGFFSLPSIWFFHLFLVALIPAVDLLLVVSLCTGAGMAIVDYALAFLLMDLLTAFAACAIEKDRLSIAWLILPMRLVYRPLLAWAVWHSIIRALRGALVEWGRQDRRGIFPGYLSNLGFSKND